MKKGNEGVIKTAADLKGKKVGVGLGTNYEEWLRQNVGAWTSVPMMTIHQIPGSACRPY